MGRSKAQKERLNAAKPKRPPRKQGQRVLFVCEGEKTEPKYLQFIKRRYKRGELMTIPPKPKDHSPVGVVEHAREFAAVNGDFDYVFCLIDRDSFDKFEVALAKGDAINAPSNSEKPCRQQFLVAWSDPCFEIWLLFHFNHGRSTIEATGGKSSGNVAKSKLRKADNAFANFDGALTQEQFDIVHPSLHNQAMTNSRKAFAEFESTKSRNPSTRMHEVFDLLNMIWADDETWTLPKETEPSG